MADLDWNGDEIQALIDEGAFAGGETAMEHLLQVSSFRAPLEEGTLARSGEASSDDTDADEPSFAVSYDTVYAVAQHEELTWKHAPGKTAKYLENPAHEEADTMLDLVDAKIRERLEG